MVEFSELSKTISKYRISKKNVFGWKWRKNLFWEENFETNWIVRLIWTKNYQVYKTLIIAIWRILKIFPKYLILENEHPPPLKSILE